MVKEIRESVESVAHEPSNDWEVNEVEGLKAYTYADKVLQSIKELGLSRLDRPKVTGYQEGLTELSAGEYFDGRLPPVLIRLSLDQLSALYSLFSNWYAYVMSTMHAVMIERSEAKRQREFLWAMIRQQHKMDPSRVDKEGNPKKRSDPEMRDMAKLDSRFVKEDARYEQLNMLYKYLEAMALVAEQDMKMISREITIQQIKIEAEFQRRGLLSGSIRLSQVNTQSFKDKQEQEDDEDSFAGKEEVRPRQPTRAPVVPKKAVATVRPAIPVKARIRPRTSS
jgi:hypothetical protein